LDLSEVFESLFLQKLKYEAEDRLQADGSCFLMKNLEKGSFTAKEMGTLQISFEEL